MKVLLPEAIRDLYKVHTDRNLVHIPRMHGDFDLTKIDPEDAQRLSLIHPEILERVPVKEVKAETPKDVPSSTSRASVPEGEKK